MSQDPLRRFGLVTRLVLAFGVVLLLSAITSATAIIQLRAVEHGMHDRVADAYFGLLAATIVDDAEDLKYENTAPQKALAAYQAAYQQVFGADHRVQQSAAVLAHATALQNAEIELRPLLNNAVQRLKLAADSAGDRYEHDPAIQILVVSSIKPLFDQWLHAIDALTEGAAQATAQTGAQQGGLVVSSVQSSMADISRSSQRMAEIVRMIDGFAFRTNILVLNAAIEAAGACKHGRGFGVVATEVRALSQGVASAARDIRRLIEQSAGEVATGQRHVENAARSMADVVNSVGGLATFVTEIAAALVEQERGIAEVDQSVHELERMTQQNAALAEQSAVAAALMSQEAERLTGLVTVFRLESAVDLIPNDIGATT